MVRKEEYKKYRERVRKQDVRNTDSECVRKKGRDSECTDREREREEEERVTRGWLSD